MTNANPGAALVALAESEVRRKFPDECGYCHDAESERGDGPCDENCTDCAFLNGDRGVYAQGFIASAMRPVTDAEALAAIRAWLVDETFEADTVGSVHMLEVVRRAIEVERNRMRLALEAFLR